MPLIAYICPGPDIVADIRETLALGQSNSRATAFTGLTVENHILFLVGFSKSISSHKIGVV